MKLENLSKAQFLYRELKNAERAIESLKDRNADLCACFSGLSDVLLPKRIKPIVLKELESYVKEIEKEVESL